MQQPSQHKAVLPLRFQMSHHVRVDIAFQCTTLHHEPHRKMQGANKSLMGKHRDGKH